MVTYHDELSWDTTGWNLICSTVIQILMVLGYTVFKQYSYNVYMPQRREYYEFIQTWVGTATIPAKNAWLSAILYVFQLIASTITMVVWICRTYEREAKNVTLDSLELVSCLYVLVFYFYNMVKYINDTPSYVWTLGALIDVYTSVPVFGRAMGILDRSWLDLGYLRVFRCVQAYIRLEQTGIIDHLSEMTRSIIITLLRTVCMVVIFAGTIFFCEVMGDPPHIEDSFIETGMGEISFYQMCYWVFTTVSTVGYGDYSPTTVLSRFFIIIFIVSGVVFFSVETGNLVELGELLESGRGCYIKKSQRRHVVLAGGGCRRRTEALNIFLQELLSEDNFADDLDVVIMNPCTANEDMRALAHETWVKKRVLYLCGSLLDSGDQERCKLADAKMAFVLADVGTTLQQREDLENIVRALAIERCCPDVPMRLMLVRPESVAKAARVGLPNSDVFCLHTLKVNMISQACRVPGFVSLMQSMVSSTSVPFAVQSKLTAERLGTDSHTWVPQYLYGATQTTIRICISEKFCGQPFKDAAVTIFKKYHVLLFAMEKGDDTRHLFPANEILRPGDMVFVVTFGPENLEHIQTTKSQSMRNSELSLSDDKHPINAARVKTCAYPNLSEIETEGPEPNVLLPSQQEALNEGHQTSAAKGHISVFPQFSGVQRSMQQSAAVNSFHRTESADELAELASGQAEDEMAWHTTAPSGTGDDSYIMALKGGHIIVCGVAQGFWTLAHTFVMPLRSRCIKPHRRIPVMLISTQPIPPGLFDEFSGVCAIQQDPTHFINLIHFGLETCSRVILFGGTEIGEEKAMVDSKVIMMSNSIETYLRWKGIDPYSKDRFIIYELADPQNLKIVPRIPMSAETIEPDPEIAPDCDLSWRNVSGNLVDSNKLSLLFARAFYAPGIMEVFEGLVSPSKTSAEDPAMPWRVNLPNSFEGMAYSQLMTSLVSGPVPALAVGLWRPGGKRGSTIGYVFTNPPPMTTISEGDCVYVLAAADFADCIDESNNLLDEHSRRLSISAEDNELFNAVKNPVVKQNTAEETDTAHLRKTVDKLFDRYDLNVSGTIDSLHELQMLTVSTFFALKTTNYGPVRHLPHDQMEKFADSLATTVHEPFEWDKSQYCDWFEAELATVAGAQEPV